MGKVGIQCRVDESVRERLAEMAAAQDVELGTFLRDFISAALDPDSEISPAGNPDVADELGRLSDETRDLRIEIADLRTNLSVVLELLLLNGPFEDDQARDLMEELRTKGLVD